MLCHRGCGLISNYINYKGLGCCSKITQHCPIVKQKIGKKNSIALKGKKLTKEHKNKISESLCGDKNPMFGKKLSAEAIIKRTATLKANKLAKRLAQGE